MRGINQENIVSFLKFLEPHLGNQRFDPETLNRWASLSHTEIRQYLNKLYNKFNLSVDQGIALEQKFQQQSSPSYGAQAQSTKPQYGPSPSRPVEDPSLRYQAPPVDYSRQYPDHRAKKKKLSPWVYLLVLVGAITVLGYIFFPQLNEAINGESTTTPILIEDEPIVDEGLENPTPIEGASSYMDSMPVLEETATTDTLIARVPRTSTTPPSSTTTAVDDKPTEDEETTVEEVTPKVNKSKAESNIHGLIKAEDNHQANKALSYFSSDIKRYWGKSNPTKSDLNNIYNSSWSKIKKSQSEVLYTNWVNPTTCDVTMDWTYEGANTGEVKTVRSTVRYTFDDNGKITSVNKVN